MSRTAEGFSYKWNKWSLAIPHLILEDKHPYKLSYIEKNKDEEYTEKFTSFLMGQNTQGKRKRSTIN